MSQNITRHEHLLKATDREHLKGHEGRLFWFTGLSASGKSTMANELETFLNKSGIHTYILDGDNVRSGLNKGLTFSEEDRVENIRRAGEVSKLMVDAGLVVISAFVSPLDKHRTLVRDIMGNTKTSIVFVDTSVEECIKRDPKGLYKMAQLGEILHFPGVNSPFERPSNADLSVSTDEQDRLNQFTLSQINRYSE